MSASPLLSERRGPVTVVTINRPEVRNCIDARTADLLAAAIDAFASDAEARVLVVTGSGDRAFCAGADLRSVGDLMRRPDVARTGPLGFSGLDPGKPTIAAVEGFCIGGGIELACWCDLRIAGREAAFGAFNRRVGVPWVDGGTQRLPRIVGVGRALYLLETGERIDAPRALDFGLVDEVVPAGGALSRALELAGRMAAYPQASLRSDRAALLGAWGRDLAAGLAYEAEAGAASLQDRELIEGARRFVEGDGPIERSGDGGAAGALHP
ncbi:MAG: enoyl-CoA hydratase-related protein [Actinomycetota bacterium]